MYFVCAFQIPAPLELEQRFELVFRLGARFEHLNWNRRYLLCFAFDFDRSFTTGFAILVFVAESFAVKFRKLIKSSTWSYKVTRYMSWIFWIPVLSGMSRTTVLTSFSVWREVWGYNIRILLGVEPKVSQKKNHNFLITKLKESSKSTHK